ncbi:MAG: 4-hydroxythreonine-4-phosphate dehydrogenase PdxA, partial [Afipia sp.]
MTRALALTIGEPAGIGPDIAIAAWLKRRELDLPAFYLIGDSAFIMERARTLGVRIPTADTTTEDAAGIFADALPIVKTGIAATALPGRPDDSSAPAAIASIRHAVADVIAGRASAVVTNPIAKSVLYRAGFSHPGHTEFLAQLSAAVSGAVPHPVMMLWSPELAVVPVTIHLPLRDAITHLTGDLIVRTARIVASDLQTR